MWAADFVGTHATEHLQSLLLLGVFMVNLLQTAQIGCDCFWTHLMQNNRDRGEAAWALLGAGIKVNLAVLDGDSVLICV